MGTYNADVNYNQPQMSSLFRDFLCEELEHIYSDQWSLDSANRVSSFCDGTGNVKCQVKFDPRIMPPL